MSLRPLGGNRYLHKGVRWVRDAGDVAEQLGVAVRAATDVEVSFYRRHWKARIAKQAKLLHLCRRTWARRSSHWRRVRRSAGRNYARLLAEGPSSRRNVAMVVETTFALGDWKEDCRWDTVKMAKS